jgi:Eukaryotic aspartyl protease
MALGYVDGSGATGDYATDKVTVGGATLSKSQIAIGYKSTVDVAVLGIGYAGLEAQTDIGLPTYDNLPLLLKKQGFIQSPAYSLWLNSMEGTGGNLLFGGVDTEKYHGSLVKLPLQSSSPGDPILEFYVKLTGVGLTKLGKTPVKLAGGATASVALLDSGTLLTYLPSKLAKSIIANVGAVYYSDYGAAYIDCAKSASLTTVDFNFNGITIKIPLGELILPNSPDDDDDQCLFGISVGDANTGVILGDTFLSSVYLVYDLANYQVYMAKTKFDATKSHIIPIKSGKNGVPQKTGSPST